MCRFLYLKTDFTYKSRATDSPRAESPRSSVTGLRLRASVALRGKGDRPPIGEGRRAAVQAQGARARHIVWHTSVNHRRRNETRSTVSSAPRPLSAWPLGLAAHRLRGRSGVPCTDRRSQPRSRRRQARPDLRRRLHADRRRRCRPRRDDLLQRHHLHQVLQGSVRQVPAGRQHLEAQPEDRRDHHLPQPERHVERHQVRPRRQHDRGAGRRLRRPHADQDRHEDRQDLHPHRAIRRQAVQRAERRHASTRRAASTSPIRAISVTSRSSRTASPSTGSIPTARCSAWRPIAASATAC